MKLRPALLLAFITAWICLTPASSAAEPPVIKTNASGAANAMMQAFGKAKPGEHYQVTLLDEHGKKLDFAAFMQDAQKGQRFVIKTDPASHAATWKLLPPGVSVHGDVSFKPPPPELKVGSRFPSFDLPLVTGGKAESAGMHGKPYLVDFFFAECVGCIEELPVLNAYAKQHPDQHVLAVTFDDRVTAAAFVRKWKFAWPVVYAGQALIDQAGIGVYPTLALIGADGRLLGLRVGNQIANGQSASKPTPHDIERWVNATLATDAKTRSPH